jgi:hypothetical protein
MTARFEIAQSLKEAGERKDICTCLVLPPILCRIHNPQPAKQLSLRTLVIALSIGLPLWAALILIVYLVERT